MCLLTFTYNYKFVTSTIIASVTFIIIISARQNPSHLLLLLALDQ